MERNRDRVSAKNAEYKPSAVAAVDILGEKVQTKGKGPSPRFKHSAEVFKNYFIVHGGRNDQQYNDKLKTVALNDLHLLEIKTSTWTTVAIFAEEIPESRWGHRLVASSNKLLLFGGMNLEQYCESAIFEIILDDGPISSFLQNKTHSTRLSMAEITGARERAQNKFLDDEEDNSNKVEHDIEGMGAVSNMI